MPDYKEMYLTLFRATESAVNILLAAQRECEDLYLNAPEPGLKFIPRPDEKRKARQQTSPGGVTE